MEKKDLKTGDWVELRRGERYMIMLDMNEGILVNKNGWIPLSEYNNDLTDKDEIKWDIVKVYTTDVYVDKYTGENLDIIWARENPKVEVSIEERIDQLVEDINEFPGLKVTRVMANGKTRCILID